MIELGPGAGERGGYLVHSGPVNEAVETLTADYLTGRKRIGIPSARRQLGPTWLEVRGARLHIPDPRPVRDALIAATALVHGMTVVTRNTADFEHCGIKLINP